MPELNVRINKYNNIEWVRLLLAAQVMFVHVFHHMDSAHLIFFGNFPGVPAFFFLSGFLIYASHLKSQCDKQYFVNRFLRLFPALLVVTLAGVGVVVLGKLRLDEPININGLVVWFLAQISIGQAFNPPEFRGLGVGVINGALWTITVEILFYISVPVIALLERRVKSTVIILFVLSFSLYAMGSELFSFELARGKSLFEFMALTPLVWGWMFLMGVLAYKNLEFILKYVRYFVFAIIPMAILILVDSRGAFFGASGNELGVLYFLLYSMIILYLCFGVRYVALKFDVSYGVYIWHMVIVNLFLVLGFSSSWLVIFFTVVMAVASWFFIEKPLLRKKKYSLLRDK